MSDNKCSLLPNGKEEGICCSATATKYSRSDTRQRRQIHDVICQVAGSVIGIFAIFLLAVAQEEAARDEHAFNGNERNELRSPTPVSRTQSIIKQMRGLLFFSSLQHFGSAYTCTYREVNF